MDLSYSVAMVMLDRILFFFFAVTRQSIWGVLVLCMSKYLKMAANHKLLEGLNGIVLYYVLPESVF